MQSRHWERISKITGHTFDVESDNFLLRNAMEAPLLKNKEDIEVWCVLVIILMTLAIFLFACEVTEDIQGNK